MKLIQRNRYDTTGQKAGDFSIGLALSSGFIPLSIVFGILFYILALLGIGNSDILILKIFPYSIGTIIIGLLIYLGITHYWAAFGLITGLVGLSLYIWWTLHLLAPWSF